MKAILFITCILTAYPRQSLGYTIVNEEAGSRDSDLTGLPVQHSSEAINTPNTTHINVSDSSNGQDEVNNFDRLTQSEGGDQGDQPVGELKLIRKRNAGKLLLNLVPNLLKDFGGRIGELLGLSPKEVQQQGLTSEQLVIMLEAIKESSCSGARSGQWSSAVFWCVTSIVILRQTIGV